MRKTVIATLTVLLAILPAAAQYVEQLDLDVGEKRVINLPARMVSDGDYPDGIVDVVEQPRGAAVTLTVSATASGTGYINVETAKGPFSYRVNVRTAGQAGNPKDTKAELQRFLADVDGLRYEIVGNRVVVTGTLGSDADQVLYDRVLALYPAGVVNMVESPELLVGVSVLVIEVDRSSDKQFGLLDFTPAAGGQGDIKLNRIVPMEAADGVVKGATKTLTWSIAGAIGTEELMKAVHGLLKSDHARIRSHPRIVVNNGSTGRVVVGGEIPYKVETQDGTNVSFKEYGVILKVTPKRKPGNCVEMKMSVEASEPSGVKIDGLPAMNKREVEIENVTVKIGQTVALAGLYNDVVTGTRSFGCLFPLFGLSHTTTEKEVWVLVTPEASPTLDPKEPGKLIMPDDVKDLTPGDAKGSSK